LVLEQGNEVFVDCLVLHRFQETFGYPRLWVGEGLLFVFFDGLLIESFGQACPGLLEDIYLDFGHFPCLFDFLQLSNILRDGFLQLRFQILNLSFKIKDLFFELV
jgi:hypothetical protein